MSETAVGIQAEIRMRREKLQQDLAGAAADINSFARSVKQMLAGIGMGGSGIFSAGSAGIAAGVNNTSNSQTTNTLNRLVQNTVTASLQQIQNTINQAVQNTVNNSVVNNIVNNPGGSGGGGAGGGGRGGSRGRLFNTRGLGRYLGAAFALNEAFRGYEGYQQYGMASDRARISGNPLDQMKAEESFQQTIGGIPLVGRAAMIGADFVGSFSGIDRRSTQRLIAQAEAQDHQTDVAKQLGTMARGYDREASMTGKGGADRATLQRKYDREDAFKKIDDDVNSIQNPESREQVKKAASAAKAAYDRVLRPTSADEARDQFAHRTSEQTGVLDLRAAGKGDEARQLALADQLREQERDIRKNVGDREADSFREEIGTRKNKELQDDISRDKTRQSNATAADVLRSQQGGENAMLQATGQTSVASQRELEQSIAARVKSLRDAAAVTLELRDKEQLLTRADAEQAAGAKEVAAANLARAHATAVAVQISSDAAGSHLLRAQGRFTQASNEDFDNSYLNRIAELRRGGDPEKMKQADALAGEYEAAKKDRAATQEQRDRSMRLQTIRANADAAGKSGVGDVEALRQSIIEDEKDVSPGDFRKATDVQRNAEARIRALRRSMMSTVDTRDADGLSLNIGNALNNGNGDAMKLLDTLANDVKANGANAAIGGPGSVASDERQVGRDMQEAAKKMGAAGDKISGAKTIAILDI